MIEKKLKNKSHLKIGARGELKAMEYLKKNDYKILDRNWFNRTGQRLGELDIIAQKDNVIIFVEVKTRKVDSLNLVNAINPEEQINVRKIDKLQKIAETYINENDLWESDWRFDAVSVIFYSNNKKPKIEHLENIFF